MSYSFSGYRAFVSLGRFIPRYFILFVAMVNGIVSLTSLSDFLLLVCRNARDFYALILRPPATIEKIWRFLKKTEIELPYVSTIPLLDRYSEKAT